MNSDLSHKVFEQQSGFTVNILLLLSMGIAEGHYIVAAKEILAFWYPPKEEEEEDMPAAPYLHSLKQPIHR